MFFLIFKDFKVEFFEMFETLVILVQKLCFHKYLLLNNLSSYDNNICQWAYLMQKFNLCKTTAMGAVLAAGPE